MIYHGKNRRLFVHERHSKNDLECADMAETLHKNSNHQSLGRSLLHAASRGLGSNILQNLKNQQQKLRKLRQAKGCISSAPWRF